VSKALKQRKRAVITGIGMLCNVGRNKQEIITNLCEERMNFQSYEAMPGIKIGKSDLPDVPLDQMESVDRIERMAFETIDEALEDAHLCASQLGQKNERVSLSFATSLYGIEQSFKGLANKQKSGLWYLYTRRGVTKIADKYQIKGSVYTTSSACASGTAAAVLGYDLIRNDEADIVLVGGVDCMSHLSLHGFNSLQALSGDICKPFDISRDGINIGEGSAFFVVEELEHAQKRDRKWYGEIIGGSLANDAYHMTSPNPTGEGANYAMRTAINEASISPHQIDYINAHGTGTKANDGMELAAMEQLFNKDEKVDTFVSSTKSRTGHCLGAAGSIELGFCLLAMENNLQLKTTNLEVAIEDKLALLKSDKKNQKIKYTLSNSFAFGGNIASIVIRK